MTCALPDADLQAWFDGALEPSQARRVQQHVAGCPACQHRLQLWADMRAVLRTQAASAHAPAHLHERLKSHLRQRERRRRWWGTAVAALVVVACLSTLGGVYWWLPRQEPFSLVTVLTTGHTALVRGEIPLAYPSADATAIQRWLEERLSFRPFIPDIGSAGLHLRGAHILALAQHAGAAIVFERGGRLYSLVSLPGRGTLPHVGQPVAREERVFQVFRQERYTLVLWSAHGLVYALVSDDDMDELLEYAALCAQQMRAPT